MGFLHLQEGDGALVQRDHQEVGDLGLGHDVDKLREVGEWVGKVGEYE